MSPTDKSFIELTTTQFHSRTGLPPGYAEWSEDQLIEGHLPIQILRIVNGEGEPVASGSRT
jgi:hypothetical protein